MGLRDRGALDEIEQHMMYLPYISPISHLYLPCIQVRAEIEQHMMQSRAVPMVLLVVQVSLTRALTPTRTLTLPLTLTLTRRPHGPPRRAGWPGHASDRARQRAARLPRRAPLQLGR